MRSALLLLFLPLLAACASNANYYRAQLVEIGQPIDEALATMQAEPAFALPVKGEAGEGTVHYFRRYGDTEGNLAAIEVDTAVCILEVDGKVQFAGKHWRLQQKLEDGPWDWEEYEIRENAKKAELREQVGY